MQTVEMRQLIHQQVDRIQDESTLQLLEDILVNLLDSSNQELPPHVIADVEAGLADITAGRVTSDADANAAIDRWLDR